MPTLKKEPHKGAEKPAVSGAKAPEKSGALSSDETIGRGWATVAARKQYNEEVSARKYYPTVKLKDGETAMIQFLDDEPYSFEAHTPKKLNFELKVCQLMTQKHCVMCDNGIRTTWRAAFRVLDYRGEWVKKEGAKAGYFKDDGNPVERILIISNTEAIQLQTLLTRLKGKKLSEIVINRTRSGSKKDTTYNYERALNEDDEVIKPMAWRKIELAPPEELLLPPTDKELLSLGLDGGSAEEEDDAVDID